MSIRVTKGGKTPLLSPTELHQLGFDLIVKPLAGLLASTKALQETYARLASGKDVAGHTEALLSFDELNRVLGLDEHYALDGKYR